LLEEAEKLASSQNVDWAQIIKNGNEEHYPEDLEDFIAFSLVSIEQEGKVLVRELLEFDRNFEFGIGLEASLNKDAITEKEINEFIKSFNAGTLKLDPTFYSFEEEDEEE
jgi:hypothetical protein